MKFAVISSVSLAFVASAGAQYLSEGWKPGQGATSAPAAPIPTYVPPVPGQAKFSPQPGRGGLVGGIADLLDLNKILTSGPFASLFGKIGVNITEKVAAAQELAKIWDERIPLITDDNFDEYIGKEVLTPEEERDRVWALIITTSSAQQGGISKIVDEIFDESYNATVIAQDLPNVRWGRIDYLNVTYITTKWAIWQAPYIVIAKDRGQTLRFYKPQHLRIRDGAFRQFLQEEAWQVSAPWMTPYSPGGSREILLHWLATVMMKIYNVTVVIPKWLMFIISGSVASFAIGLLHGGTSSSPPAAKPKVSGEPAAIAPPPTEALVGTSTGASPKKGSAKQRKGKK